MHFPQVVNETGKTRGLFTSDMDELARFHFNKNRHYTQLQPGALQANFIEAALGNVQVFREQLNVGARIQAAPTANILPFAFVLPCSGSYRFCSREGLGNTFVQASGGTWEINFKDKLEYVGSAFSREYFAAQYEKLKQQPLPKHYLISKIAPTIEQQGLLYSLGVSNILAWVSKNPYIYQLTDVVDLLCSQVFQLTVDALPPVEDAVPLRPYSQRIKAVKKVIDYLQACAKELPDIPKLCRVAGVSERSLQYGFIDYLGLTPIQYLRVVRLNGARSDLLQSQQHNVKVADIAMAWGFLEFGRFSREYKKLFLELPSKTLSR